MSEKLADLAPSFARALRGDGATPRTVATYLEALGQFTAWLEDQGRPATVDDLTNRLVRDWLAHLREQGRAPNTVRGRHVALAKFAKWLVREDEVERNPLDRLTIPAAEMKPVPLLDDDELRRLLAVCSGRDFASRRNEAMIRVLLDCGVRAGELTGMTVDAVNLDAESAMIVGKGSKIRTIYFSAKTTKALDRYLRARRTHPKAELPALWLSQVGALTSDGMRVVVAKLGEAAGIPGLHPHRLRHTYAHDWLQAGGGEHDLMRLAGWSSTAMLARYGAAGADQRAREAARRLRRGDRV